MNKGITDKFDRPVSDLRISVTDKCNFRCGYCMPEEVYGYKYEFLPKEKILSFEEIERLAVLYTWLGVTKIRITGGEPLLRQELPKLISRLAQISGITDLALTTNGYLLADQIYALRDAGLKRLTVSLDTLKPDLFRKLAGSHLELSRVLLGIEVATAAGFQKIKLNTVIQRGVNDNEVLALVEFARQHDHTIRFIEFMDVGNLNEWRMETVVSSKEIIAAISEHFPIVPMEKTYRSEVANRYRYLDGYGEFGVIASVTQPFCGDCTRVRISADGKIYTCLFASEGKDVKELLRSDASDNEILQELTESWQQRDDRYSEERSQLHNVTTKRKVEMYHIGG